MTPPWMPLYVADYLADTGHLSTVEHGAYLLLIMHYWQSGGLPSDDKKLARIARLSPREWAGVRETVSEFFDDGWRHGRIDEEMARAEDKINKRSAAGRAGAAALHGKRSGKRSGKRKANACQPPSPSHSQEEANASSDAREDFEIWWSEYPHKVGKGQARKAFKAARKSASLETLVEGVRRYVAAKPPDRQWCNPATWLNGERWLDEEAPPDGGQAAAEDEADRMIEEAAREADRRNAQHLRADHETTGAAESSDGAAAGEGEERPAQREIRGNGGGLRRLSSALPAVGAGGGREAGAGEPPLRQVAEAGGTAGMVPAGAEGHEAETGAQAGPVATGAAPVTEPGGTRAQRLADDGAAGMASERQPETARTGRAGAVQGGSGQAPGVTDFEDIPSFLDRRRRA